MSRQEIRNWKRALRRAQADGSIQLARDAALSLLARSIEFRHARLAILRFADAVGVGAQPAPDQWRYCQDAASASKDPALRKIYRRAATAASSARPAGPGEGAA